MAETSTPTAEGHIVNPHMLFGQSTWASATAAEREKMAQDIEPYRPIATTDTPPTSPGIYARLSAEPNSYTPPPSKSAGYIRASPHAAKVRAQVAAMMGADKVSNGHLIFSDFNTLLREMHAAEEADQLAAADQGSAAPMQQ